MYYNGTDSDHYIWRLNTTDDSKGMLYGGNCYMPPTVIDDTTAYFMDCDSNYAIARTDLATGEKTPKSGISNHAAAGICDDPCLSKFGTLYGLCPQAGRQF